MTLGARTRSRIRDIPDYPTPGILFKDITPLLGDAQAFAEVVEAFAAPYRPDALQAATSTTTAGSTTAGSTTAGSTTAGSTTAGSTTAGSTTAGSTTVGSTGPIDLVVGIEARGFILGAPVAVALGAGFAPVRKSGKLPFTTVGASYALEYGTAQVELHTDGVSPGQRVLVVDDVLATGGTAAAACDLVERLGGVVACVAVLMELTFLDGRSKLGGRPLYPLISL